ncbi:MAG: glycine--tRNA ligase subunit beta, partial [Thermodesulfobacteriota bacterium]
MAKDLLLEIGTEELPAGFIPVALAALEALAKRELDAGRLSFKGMRTLGTPRRLALIVEGLEEKQPDTKVEQKGPHKKAAYDNDGKPTKALLGFARSRGVDVGELKTVKTEKGEYLYAIKEVKGERTVKVLPAILEAVVSGLTFPKAMRWGEHGISFARPVHWILSLYGKTTVPFTFGHIKSGPHTRGHRFLKPKGGGKPIKVDGVKTYLEGLRKNFVIADPAERKELIAKGLEKEAKKIKGEILPDEGLLDEVVNLVEYPVVVKGSFDKEFLDLPAEVVINAMREHQRYFSVVDGKGEKGEWKKLLPCFLTVANTKARELKVVREGNERVLRARLNDAKFYFEKDVKTPL